MTTKTMERTFGREWALELEKRVGTIESRQSELETRQDTQASKLSLLEETSVFIQKETEYANRKIEDLKSEVRSGCGLGLFRMANLPVLLLIIIILMVIHILYNINV